MRIIYLLFGITGLLFGSFLSYGQELSSLPCPVGNCDCLLNKASKAADDPTAFKEVLNLYFAAIACDENLRNKAEEGIEALFKRIDQLRVDEADARIRAAANEKQAKTNAEAARAAQSKAESFVRASRNVALANRVGEYDPTLALNILKYNLDNFPEDEPTPPLYHQFAQYNQAVACRKVFTSNQAQVVAKDTALSVAISQDNNRCFIAYSNGINVWNTTDSTISRIAQDGISGEIDISADGSKCIYYNLKHQLVYQDILRSQRFVIGEADLTAAASTDFKGQYLPRSRQDTKSQNGEMKYTISTFKLAADGSFCIIGTHQGGVYKWSPKQSDLVQYPGGHSSSVRSISISTRDSAYYLARSDTVMNLHAYFLTGGTDGISSLWRSNEVKRIIQAYLGHLEAISAVALSPTGKMCITASEDYTFKSWELETGRLVNTFAGFHTSPVSQISFSPDGRFFMTGNSHEPSRLWEANGRPLGSFPEIRAPFSLSNESVLALGPDGKARLWCLKAMDAGRDCKGYQLSLEELKEAGVSLTDQDLQYIASSGK